ncbi:MAG: hypothetical protein K8I30_05805, partial [Anaerolineae bacterium]|nr:hypothetical protein [Anaerolineae bacterium]
MGRRSVHLRLLYTLLLIIVLLTAGGLRAQDAEPRVLRIASLVEPPGMVGYIALSGAAMYYNE